MLVLSALTATDHMTLRHREEVGYMNTYYTFILLSSVVLNLHMTDAQQSALWAPTSRDLVDKKVEYMIMFDKMVYTYNVHVFRSFVYQF